MSDKNEAFEKWKARKQELDPELDWKLLRIVFEAGQSAENLACRNIAHTMHDREGHEILGKICKLQRARQDAKRS